MSTVPHFYDDDDYEEEDDYDEDEDEDEEDDDFDEEDEDEDEYDDDEYDDDDYDDQLRLIAKNLRYCFAAKNFALGCASNNTKLSAKYMIKQFGEHHGKTNDTRSYCSYQSC